MLKETSFYIIDTYSTLLALNTELHNYCDTSYSRGWVNQIWILMNSKDPLEYIQSRVPLLIQ